MKQHSLRNGLLVSLAAILATGFIAVSMQNANAQTVLQGYPSSGRTIGDVNASITKTINMHGLDELNLVLIAAGGGADFNNTNLVVQASVDNTNFITVDTIALGNSSATYARAYDESSPGSTLAINPAVFPYVKLSTSAVGGGVVQNLTYSAR